MANSAATQATPLWPGQTHPSLGLSTSPSSMSSVSGASGSAISSYTSGSTASQPLPQCAVCQDAASGVHYGVPACEGCKGFFRRIVSSRNPAGACSHASPLVITPQTRNACQWCRLKKCCAVNMGRQRSKLGRRIRPSGDSGRRLKQQEEQQTQPSSTESVETGSVTNQQLLLYIELKRREFEGQINRGTGFRRQNSMKASLPRPSAPVNQSIGRCFRPLRSRLDSSSSRPMPRDCQASGAWLAGCQPPLSGQSLTRLCHRLAGGSDARTAAWLRSRCARRGVPGAAARLVLCAVDKFVQYWEADLNNQFGQNPRCGGAIAESTELIIEGHRRTAYFCQDRMAQLREERLPMLREPAVGEESAVLSHLVGCIPQLMLRIVAFARNILGSGSGIHLAAAEAAGHLTRSQEEQQRLADSSDRVLASRCSDVLLDVDKRQLIVHHCFKLVAMRFCDALVQCRDGYIIDPALHYRLTKEFLLAANHPMLSQLFLKFFDVSKVWDSHSVTENELAFLSAICLTSPFLDGNVLGTATESPFEDSNAVVSVHSAVIGLFWIHLRSAEMTNRGCNPAMIKSDSRLNLELRVKALSRIMELSDVFDALQSIDSLHKQNAAMIDGIVERLSAARSAAQPDGFPDFSAAFNPVGQPSPQPELLNQYGAGIYQEVFGPLSDSS